MEADLDEAQTQLGEATTKLENTEKQLSTVIILDLLIISKRTYRRRTCENYNDPNNAFAEDMLLCHALK